MIKNLIIPLIVVAAFIVAVGIFIQKTGTLAPTSTPAPSATITIDNKKVGVELAKTADERSKGLSGRSSLDANSGMLFVFGGGSSVPTFWMKDMLFPLDMIWISSGKIIRIDKNLPIPSAGTPDSKLKTYSAGVPVDYVLEVNAGFADSNNIKVGDSVATSGI